MRIFGASTATPGNCGATFPAAVGMTVAKCCVLVFLLCGRGGEAFAVNASFIDAVCQDHQRDPGFVRYNMTCAQVKTKGYCSRNIYMAKKYCEQTCGECTPTLATVPNVTNEGLFLNSNRTWCGPSAATGPRCCCNSPWRGPSCGDFDECASSPCWNGGTCEDSSRTEMVNDYHRK